MKKIDVIMLIVGMLLTLGAVGGIERATMSLSKGFLLSVIGLALVGIVVYRSNRIDN